MDDDNNNPDVPLVATAAFMKGLQNVPVSGSNYGTDKFLFNNKELVSSLQVALKLPQTGVPDTKLIQAITEMLENEKIPGYMASPGDALTAQDIGALQYSLRKSGDYPAGDDPLDRVDGKFGAHAQAALIKRLQRQSPGLRIMLESPADAPQASVPTNPSGPNRKALINPVIPAGQTAASTGGHVPSEAVLQQYAGPAGDTRKLRAFLDMVGDAEGTTKVRGSDNGYNAMIGGSTFDDYSRHPHRSLYITNIKNSSDGAGRYGIMGFAFEEYKKRLHLPDFSPASQDAIALQIIADKGALPDILAGNYQAAIFKVRKVWASFPGAGYYHQNGPGMATLERAYNRSLASSVSLSG